MQVSATLGQQVDVQKCRNTAGTWSVVGEESILFQTCVTALEKRKVVVFTLFNQFFYQARSARDVVTLKRLRACFHKAYRFGGIEELQHCLRGISAMQRARTHS